MPKAKLRAPLAFMVSAAALVLTSCSDIMGGNDEITDYKIDVSEQSAPGTWQGSIGVQGYNVQFTPNRLIVEAGRTSRTMLSLVLVASDPRWGIMQIDLSQMETGVQKLRGDGLLGAGGEIRMPGIAPLHFIGSISPDLISVTPATPTEGRVNLRFAAAGAQVRWHDPRDTPSPLTGSISVSFDTSPAKESSGSGGGGGALSLACPGTLPSGFHCLPAVPGGPQAPFKWNVPELINSTWVDTGVDLCITYGANGNSVIRTKGGGLAGPPTNYTGKWGVLVKRSGAPEGDPMWRVFTTGVDPQSAMLTYNSTSKQMVVGGWRKGSCPW